MVSAGPRTDWSLLSGLLQFARRDGWGIAFERGTILFVHRRTERGVVVLPAALLGPAREAGWRVAKRREGIELRHPAVRRRIELRLVAA